MTIPSGKQLPLLNEAHIRRNEEAKISELHRIAMLNQEPDDPHRVFTLDQGSKQAPSSGSESNGKPGCLKKAAISDLH